MQVIERALIRLQPDNEIALAKVFHPIQFAWQRDGGTTIGSIVGTTHNGF